MTPQHYHQLLDWLDARPTIKHLVIGANRWLPLIPFLCYPTLLVWLTMRCVLLLWSGSGGVLEPMQALARAILVPGIVFWLGTVLRARLDRPRPYQQPGFTPLVPKETAGKSFPSRHALSAAVLAAVWLYFCPPVGLFLCVVALLLCVVRVLAGVHFVRDVVAGAVFGFVLGALGMWFL